MEARPPQELVYTVVGCDDDEPPNNIITYRTYIPDPASDFTVLCKCYNNRYLFMSMYCTNDIFMNGIARGDNILGRDPAWLKKVLEKVFFQGSLKVWIVS